MNKKDQEKLILQKFINVYKEQFNDLESIEILENSKAKLLFPNYNGENPDCIVLLNGKYIAIELFELVRNNVETLNLNHSEENLDIKNAAHLHSIREKNNNHSFYMMEDLAVVAIERINYKIENKLKNYVNCPIWLVGHSSKPFNCSLLLPYFEDKIENKVAEYIASKILKDNRIEKIWLLELFGETLLLEIK
ncbi:MAG: hypothetical protein WC879_12570 [Melioribacteraceae bacterium]